MLHSFDKKACMWLPAQSPNHDHAHWLRLQGVLHIACRLDVCCLRFHFALRNGSNLSDGRVFIEHDLIVCMLFSC